MSREECFCCAFLQVKILESTFVNVILLLLGLPSATNNAMKLVKETRLRFRLLGFTANLVECVLEEIHLELLESELVKEDGNGIGRREDKGHSKMRGMRRGS